MREYATGIVIAIVIIALVLYVQNRVDRMHARALRPQPGVRRPAARQTVTRPIESPRTAAPLVPPAPRPTVRAPAVPPASKTTAAPPLDPLDPLVRRYNDVTALLALAFVAVDGLPSTLDDRVAMRTMAMVIELTLKEIRQGLPTSNPGARTAYATQLDKLDRQITSLRVSAQNIATSYASLQELLARLPYLAGEVLQQLDALAHAAAYPLVWSASKPIITAAIQLIGRLPQPYEICSYDDLKRQLHLARGLLSDLEDGQRAAATSGEQHTRLLALLAHPELAVQPEWLRAITLLTTRSHALGAPVRTAGDDQLAALRHDANALLERRRSLFVDLELDDHGGYRLTEDRLPQLIDEATTIQQEVHSLSRRARALVAAQRAGLI
jgi:hypothetical protein